MEKKTNRWIFIIVFLIILFLMVSFIAGIASIFISVEEPLTGNVALIPIKGMILPDKTQMFGQEGVSASDVVKNIEKADKAENVKAIIFEINSPGGAVVASEEIVSAIKKTDKLTVAYIREVGASGAYWAASATEHIIASRMSITGSLGVIASYLQFSGLLEKYNITYQRLISGKYKDIGSPLKELSFEEEKMLQKQIELIHEYFVEEVAKNRNLSKDIVEEISTAKLFLGIEAKELGLIDEFGGKEEAIKFIEEKLNITADVKELVERKGLLDMLSQVMNEKSFFVGRGIGSSLLDQRMTNKIEIWS